MCFDSGSHSEYASSKSAVYKRIITHFSKSAVYKRIITHFSKSAVYTEDNESTTGADASVEALKLYHMKLTLAYSSLLALL